MKPLVRSLATAVDPLGDGEALLVVSDESLGRDGDIWMTSGAQLGNYRKNPIVLWQHDVRSPVGTAPEIGPVGPRILARAAFAPPGASQKADEIRALVKAGVVSGVSAGIQPLETEPLDRNQPRGGQRIVKWDLLEISFCCIPANVAAMVIQGSVRDQVRAYFRARPVDRAEAELIAVAAEFGEVLTSLRRAQITAQASQLGQSPAGRYNWLRAADKLANGAAVSYLQRQADKRRLGPR